MLTLPLGFRLHASLLFLSEELPRRFGGLGLVFPTGGGAVSLKPDHKSSDALVNGVVDKELTEFSQTVADRLGVALCGIQCSLRFPRHCGFGTGTQIRIAIIRLYCKLRNIDLPASEIILLSGRGGASGIGIRMESEPKLIFDFGRPAGTVERFLPSSALAAGGDQPYISVPFPYSAVIASPLTDRGPSGDEERRLFNQICPISRNSAIEAAFWGLIYPYSAAVDSNFAGLVDAIDRLQGLEWKMEVKARLSRSVQNAKRSIERQTGVPFFVSSWGPGLFALLENQDKARVCVEMAEASDQGVFQLHAV
jgi:beta-ribofuranosylaminobenzene 5'-phosphate synthase